MAESLQTQGASIVDALRELSCNKSALYKIKTQLLFCNLLRNVNKFDESTLTYAPTPQDANEGCVLPSNHIMPDRTYAPREKSASLSRFADSLNTYRPYTPRGFTDLHR